MALSMSLSPSFVPPRQVPLYSEVPMWAEVQPDPIVRDVPTNPNAFDADSTAKAGGGGGGVDVYGQPSSGGKGSKAKEDAGFYSEGSDDDSDDSDDDSDEAS